MTSKLTSLGIDKIRDDDVFRLAIDVVVSDIDFMGHVNNAVHLRWVQEVVLAHWHTLAPADAVADHLRVARRHEVNYRQPIKFGASVTVEHRFKAASGCRAMSTTSIASNGKIASSIESIWCGVDARSGRPRKLPQYLKYLFFSNERGFVGTQARGSS